MAMTLGGSVTAGIGTKLEIHSARVRPQDEVHAGGDVAPA